MKQEKNNKLEIMRHSLAHIMATAILELWPNVKFGIGPAIENGFYYDFDLSDCEKKTFDPQDLLKIEKRMKKIIQQNFQFEKKEISIDKAKKIFKDQPYKLELLKDLQKNKKTITIYSTSYKLQATSCFIDLCAGPHVNSTKEIPIDSFKLDKLAGAYWRGDEKNKMLTRIYGLAFNNKTELDNYLVMMAEAEKRDHRKLGKELDLFSFHDEGPGFAFWHPRGMILREALMKLHNKLHKETDYGFISTPILLSEELWHQSGHWDNYKDAMSFVKIENKIFAIKPMSCPGAILIYKNCPRSYKEFPIRFAENGEVHRHEPSGTLRGLFRVRAFRQDDAHIFAQENQIEKEIKNIIKLILKFYKIFNFANVKIELSTRPEKSIGSDEIWEKSEQILKKALDNLELEFKINKGDGAFYGPKIDFHIKDSIGRFWQCGTIQLDFSMPEKFNLEYIDNKGCKKQPTMIHRTIMGSIQRFVGILIEHYAGAFPVWLSPVQVKIISVAETHIAHCKKVADEFKNVDIRVEIDDADETVGNKIRKAIAEKAPYMLVIGDKEMASNKLNIRDRGEKTTREISKEEFIQEVENKIKEKE